MIIQRLHEDIFLLEDWLPTGIKYSIDNIFITNNLIDWYWNDNTQKGNTKLLIDSKTINSPQFVHMVYHKKHGYTSVYSTEIMSILTHLPNTGIITIKDTLRVKSNLITKGLEIDRYKYNPPHQDTNLENGWALLYYINDSDGPTQFFKEIGLSELNTEPESFNELLGCNPKSGSAILFNARRWHSSRVPIDNHRRMVINYLISGELTDLGKSMVVVVSSLNNKV